METYQIDVREKIQNYLDIISTQTGRRFHVEFKGLLTTIYDGPCIIYTSAGGFPQVRYNNVETFLGGIVYGLRLAR